MSFVILFCNCCWVISHPENVFSCLCVVQCRVVADVLRLYHFHFRLNGRAASSTINWGGRERIVFSMNDNSFHETETNKHELNELDIRI